MDDRLYFKSKKDFKTIYDTSYVDYDAPIYSSEKDSGTFRIIDLEDRILDIKDDLFWLCYKNHIFHVCGIDPGNDGTFEIKVEPPAEAFYRTHIHNIYHTQSGRYEVYINQGKYLQALFEKNYKNQPDKEHAYPYLITHNEDYSPILVPDFVATYTETSYGPVRDTGFFIFSDYLRKLSKNTTILDFSYDNNSLTVSNYKKSTTRFKQLINGDGHTMKTSYAYSQDVVEKVTVDVLGKDPSDETRTIIKQSYNFYLTDGINFSATVPSTRKKGRWERTSINEASQGSTDTDLSLATEAAQKIFEKNKEEIKIEFYHDKFLRWGEPVKIKIGNYVWQGDVSSCRISSDDNRYFYTIGELKSTITQKLKALL